MHALVPLNVISSPAATARIVGTLVVGFSRQPIVDALARFKAGERFDAVLCDVMMPGMSGEEFYKALQVAAAAEARKVVFITGSTCSPEVEAFLARSGRPHLAKPSSRQELFGALSTVA